VRIVGAVLLFSGASLILVDTGAVRTILPPHVVARLGLGSRGQRMAEYADGRKEAVVVTGPVIVELEGLVLGDEVLIGQTVLENRRVVPNPAHPDQPVTKVK
jgi:predicted aspartyl protease